MVSKDLLEEAYEEEKRAIDRFRQLWQGLIKGVESGKYKVSVQKLTRPPSLNFERQIDDRTLFIWEKLYAYGVLKSEVELCYWLKVQGDKTNASLPIVRIPPVSSYETPREGLPEDYQKICKLAKSFHLADEVKCSAAIYRKLGDDIVKRMPEREPFDEPS